MRRLKRNAVKEAFDNLPSGICFFDINGMLTLCNYQMHRLIFALTGRDLQSLADILNLLKNPPVADAQPAATQRDGDIFLVDDGSAWQFFVEKVTTRAGGIYTQILAADVTELYRRKQELKEDNRRLNEYAERMRRLSANIITLIREEEILNMKMRIHDDIGRSVIATRQFLMQNRPMEELDLTTWKMAVRLLKQDNVDREEEDVLARLETAASGLNIKIVMNGKLPEDSMAAGLLYTAVRECMSNAVRHAQAGKLYVEFSSDEHTASAVITNDGRAPEGEITEGGGLSSLRVRMERAGGSMKVQSTPYFALMVTVPAEGRKQDDPCTHSGRPAYDA